MHVDAVDHFGVRHSVNAMGWYHDVVDSVEVPVTLTCVGWSLSFAYRVDCCKIVLLEIGMEAIAASLLVFWLSMASVAL